MYEPVLTDEKLDLKILFNSWRKRNKRKNFKNHQKRDDLFEKHKL